MTDKENMAFPQENRVGEISITEGGLTKREWYAAHIAAGLLAGNPEIADNWLASTVASYAFEVADALALESQKVRQ